MADGITLLLPVLIRPFARSPFIIIIIISFFPFSTFDSTKPIFTSPYSPHTHSLIDKIQYDANDNHQKLQHAAQSRASLQSLSFHYGLSSSVYCFKIESDGWIHLLYAPSFHIPHSSATFPILNLFIASCYIRRKVFPRLYRPSRQRMYTYPFIDIYSFPSTRTMPTLS